MHRNYSLSSRMKSHQRQEITFIMVGDNTVGINMPYRILTYQIKTIIRNNKGYWNSDIKIWCIPFESYQLVSKQIATYYTQKQSILINSLSKLVYKQHHTFCYKLQVQNYNSTIKKAITYSPTQQLIDIKTLPFYSKLYEFQKQCIQFAILKHARLLIADQMGIGKTIQSLAITYIFKHQWPLLIICPSSLKYNWYNEILSWFPQIQKSSVQLYTKYGVPIRQASKIIIVSYELACKLKMALDQYNVVIADEAHYLKNYGNQRSQFLVPFLASRKRILLLTGTPALAKPRQIFNLLTIIRPDLFTHFKQFGTRYCQPTQNPWSRRIQYNGCKNDKELHYLIKNRIMIRRTKKEVLKQLPDKQRQKIVIETDKKIVSQIAQKLRQSNINKKQLFTELIRDEDTRQTILECYRLTGISKLWGVKEYIQNILRNEIKILIFAHHHRILDELEQFIKGQYEYIRIDGNVENQRRNEYVKQFQNNSKVLVALLSITAASVGITLTAATTVIFAQLHWTPATLLQAEDRAHRIGQKNSVNCHYLIGQNTIDQILYASLQKKLRNVSSFIDGKSQELNGEFMGKGQIGKYNTQINKPLMKKQISLHNKIRQRAIHQTDRNDAVSQDTEISDDPPNQIIPSRRKIDEEDQNLLSNQRDSKKSCFQSSSNKNKNITNIEECNNPTSIDERSDQERRTSDIQEFLLENVDYISQLSQETASFE